MTFNSLQFVVFFVVVLALYFRFDVRGQNRLMVVAGAVFYGWFDWRYLGLLYLSAGVDFVVGRAIEGSDVDRRRKQLLATSLVVQLGILGFFKYFDFFTDSAASALDKLGLHLDPVTLSIVLPVGISFYTFQSLNYVFAVYRRQIDAERDLVTFTAFVSWFPQLVAGPIERAPSLLPQVRRRRDRPEADVIESGVTLIFRGLFKKIVIADSVAGFVNTVYSQPNAYSGATLAIAAVGFAVQVYGDFAGYSDIARGTSRLLGVELRRNFEQPFLSRDMREFWQRWHTSLGSWFVENVAQPMGGASRGRARAVFNVLFMFALIGLWHGPAWTFVFWGFLNGVFVAMWRFLPAPRRRHPMKVRLRETPQIALTFGLFVFGAVFFRSASFHAALRSLKGIITFRAGLGAPAGALLVPIMLVLVLGLDLLERRQRINAIETLRIRATLGGVATSAREAAMEAITVRINPAVSGVLIGAMATLMVVFSGGAPTPFIYFQF
jgi:D-alanyl-lipoteichoic acid acyltransferase DltB (MBOAT superfamily)